MEIHPRILPGCEASRDQLSHTATAAWSDARYLLVPLRPLTGQFGGTEYFASTSRHPAALTLTWARSLDYASRGCPVAHFARYGLPITAEWKCNSPLTLRRRPSRLSGLLHLCHPPHTNAAHLLYRCLVILQFPSPFLPSLSICRLHLNHQNIHHHALAEAAPPRQHNFTLAARPTCAKHRFPTFTTTQGPLARHW